MAEADPCPLCGKPIKAYADNRYPVKPYGQPSGVIMQG